mmetsp:Transcript_8990/g.25022  ORF Transcript_8990/g.25022 Transcript_8990/m.25022 type:complete len:96 (-) Transcript_8990:15-302(-)
MDPGRAGDRASLIGSRPAHGVGTVAAFRAREFGELHYMPRACCALAVAPGSTTGPSWRSLWRWHCSGSVRSEGAGGGRAGGSDTGKHLTYHGDDD